MELADLCVMEDGSRATDIGQIQDAAPFLGDFSGENNLGGSSHSHRIHGTNGIFTYIWLKFMVNDR